MNPILSEIHSALGITQAHLAACKLQLCEEPLLSDLEVVAIDFSGRPFVLTRAAAEAWRRMRLAANESGIRFEPISGFRSYIYQQQIIERKLLKGSGLSTVLTETAIPGFSEHHGGCAVDLGSDGHYELRESFEQTRAFQWLLENAHRFNFYLSYPRDNQYGIIFEPWHWCFRQP